MTEQPEVTELAAVSVAAQGEEPGAPGTPPDPIVATSGASLFSGGLWHSASKLLPEIFTLIISVTAARALGVHRMGEQSYISFLQVTTVMVLTGGLPIALMRYIGEMAGRGRADLVRTLISWGWRIEGAAAVCGALFLLVYGSTKNEHESAWALAAFAGALGILHAVPSAVLIGLQRWRESSSLGMSLGFAATAATVTVLLLGGGIVGMFAVEVVIAVIRLFLTARIAQRVLSEVDAGSAPLGEVRGDIARYAGYLTVSTFLSLLLYRRSEFFFLEHYSSPAQIAVYSIPFALVAALSRIPEALATVAMPAFATLFGEGSIDRIRVSFARLLRLLLVMTIPVTAGAAATGPAVIRLIYGSEYRDAGPVILVMLTVLPILPLVTAAEALVTGLGKARVPLLIQLGASGLNVGLAFLLVPALDAIGAAGANAAAQLAASLPLLMYASRCLGGGIRVDLGSVVKLVVVAVVGAVAAWVPVTAAGGAIGIVAGVLAGGAVMYALARILRPITADDGEWIADVTGDRFGGRLARLAAQLSA